MANQEHLDILKQGVEVWNTWRKEHTDIMPDLSEAYLSEMYLSSANLSSANLNRAIISHTDLSGANLNGTNLNGAYLGWTNLGWTNLKGVYLKEANLGWANLIRANLKEANLNRAYLGWANLKEANFIRANLNGAYLGWANLSEANFSEVNLSEANLSRANLIITNFTNANLTGCSIFGISAWKVNVEGAIQKDLVITDLEEPKITVDNLEVAQFIYLLLNNQKIRDVMNTITSKVVLILGRFTNERKPVLDVLRDELRKHNYSPVVFDFEKPGSRNLTETVSTLAHLSRFIIADLTDAKSIPQELERIVPRLRVPVQSLLHISESDAYAMYSDFEAYHWVLPLYRYGDLDTLLSSLQIHIINPAEQKAQELEKRK